MQLRNSGHRDERRRRVLMDESRALGNAERSLSSPAADQPTRTPVESLKRYADVALTSHQPRIGALIPCRIWTLTVWTGALLACVAGLESLYGYVSLGYLKVGSTRIAVEQLAAIDLAGSANVAKWFSAWLLGMAAVMGYLTYLIRRHRLDDYRGRYRMWYWVVALLILASLDQVAGIQESVRVLLLEIAGVPNFSSAMLMWSAGLTGVLAVVGIRVAIEMRASRLAVFALVGAACCFAAVTATQLGLILTVGGVFQTMVTSALTMGGHVALLGAFCLYARHVHRDACGQFSAKRRRRRSPKRLVAADDGDRPKRTVKRGQKATRIDAKHTTASTKTRERPRENVSVGRSGTGVAETPTVSSSGKRRRTRRHSNGDDVGVEVRSSAANVDASIRSDDELAQESPSRPLSKAERKRLRKQKRKQ